jgi:hypothetical protein
MSMRSVILAALLGIAVLAGAVPSLAAEEEQTPGWQFEVMPYAWLPGTFGTIEVKGRTATVDTTIGDVLTLLWHGDAFALGGYFGARYDRWSLFADAYGGYFNESVTERVPTRFCTVQVGATARLHPVLADVAVGYQLGEWRVPDWRRPISLGVYLGTRIVHLGVDLETSAGVVGGIQGGGRNVSDSFTTATPMLGVRWEIPVHDQVSFDFRGDLGGLPGGSRLNWNFVGDVRYWLDWSPGGGTQLWLEAGYRVVGFNHDFGGGNDLELQLRGPLLAVGFAF